MDAECTGGKRIEEKRVLSRERDAWGGEKE